MKIHTFLRTKDPKRGLSPNYHSSLGNNKKVVHSLQIASKLAHPSWTKLSTGALRPISAFKRHSSSPSMAPQLRSHFSVNNNSQSRTPQFNQATQFRIALSTQPRACLFNQGAAFKMTQLSEVMKNSVESSRGFTSRPTPTFIKTPQPFSLSHTNIYNKPPQPFSLLHTNIHNKPSYFFGNMFLQRSFSTPRVAKAPPKFKLPKKDAITLTSKAAERIRELIHRKNDPEVLGIRIGVKKRGCNGLSYTMDYAKAIKPQDEQVVHEPTGVKVLIEPGALLSVVGTEMDFVEDKMAAEFVFLNPNAKSLCGCGESFTI